MTSYNSLYKEAVKKRVFLVSVILLFFNGCAVKQRAFVTLNGKELKYKNLSKNEKEKIKNLYKTFLSLSPYVDKAEAEKLSFLFVLYPIYLSRKYSLSYPPLFHNFLVNLHIKDRGLCYQWVEDILSYINCSEYKSFDFHWGVANRGKINEHNVIVVTAKGDTFENGIVLDPWRNSGDLFFTKVNKDKSYEFVEWKDKSKLYGCIP